jgi:hypothetical protein
VEVRRLDDVFAVRVLVGCKGLTSATPVVVKWGLYREVLDEIAPPDQLPPGSRLSDDDALVCTTLAETGRCVSPVFCAERWQVPSASWELVVFLSQLAGRTHVWRCVWLQRRAAVRVDCGRRPGTVRAGDDGVRWRAATGHGSVALCHWLPPGQSAAAGPLLPGTRHSE